MKRILIAVCVAGMAAGLATSLAWSPAPLGTAFTYQGQLKEAGAAVTDTADFRFSLWRDPNSVDPRDQAGATIALSDVSVVSGLFTVSLDFGADALDGEAQWLEIAARRPAWDGSGDEPLFTTMAPRHRVRPYPYALRTRGIYVDPAGNVGIGTTSPTTKLDVAGDIIASGESTGRAGLSVMVPKGSTIMWSGTIDDNGDPLVNGVADPNWNICDGSDGTLDLRDRFIVGAGAGYNTGETGGAASVTLSIDQIPNHSHSFSGQTSSDGDHAHGYQDKYRDRKGWYLGGDYPPMSSDEIVIEQSNTDSDGAHSHQFIGSTSPTGGSGSHENRPPYYALAFIKHTEPARRIQATGRIKFVAAPASTSAATTALAEPVSSAFTYQGQLKEDDIPVTDSADFEFSLWSDPESTYSGDRVGDTITLGEVDIVDGRFTVSLDFGAEAFSGEARWLRIAVRHPAWGGGEGPPFTTLSPRQALSGVPYALQTSGLHVDAAGQVGIGTSSPAAKLDVVGNIIASGDSTGRGGLSVMVPAGAIIMYDGGIDAGGLPLVGGVPDPRWHLCDGNAGTPNLRDRFIVGAGADYTTGDTGGESVVALALGQLPSHDHGSLNGATESAGAHSHEYDDWHTAYDPFDPDVWLAAGLSRAARDVRARNTVNQPAGLHGHSISGSTDATGGNDAHENRPPYHALSFIMYVGEVPQKQAKAGVELAAAHAVALTDTDNRGEPTSAAFTYQGQLEDMGAPVTGTVDLVFSLWSDAESTDPGDWIGEAIPLGSVNVVNGLFTVSLDFGAEAFNGEARWLETAARHPAWDDLGDEPPFIRLSPRQPLTAVPYALQTRGLHVDDAGNVSIGTTSPAARLDVAGDIIASGESTGRGGLSVMVPQGSVVMWSGGIDDNSHPLVDGVPDTRWHICDGNAGTPDLRGRFIVGAGGNYAAGVTGGAARVTLGPNHVGHSHSFSGETMPIAFHTHGFKDRWWQDEVDCFSPGGVSAANNGTDTRTGTTSTAGSHSHTFSGNTASVGGEGDHENRPPYFALTFIMNVGEP
ncbi:MAG: hypothetical protein JSU63_06530 [Phycisphaerales bacterium]|nr:MAG: hypothetical protein JSU63_06530 [Phycisphaerales bacterium]